VARGTQVFIGTFASVKYFSHCLSQLNDSSPENGEKSSLGIAMERLNCGGGPLWVWVLMLGLVVWVVSCCCLGGWFQFSVVSGMRCVHISRVGEWWWFGCIR
jgi:hypothetical protein